MHGAGLLRSTNEKGMTGCHPQSEQVLILQMVQCGLGMKKKSCMFANALTLG